MEIRPILSALMREQSGPGADRSVDRADAGHRLQCAVHHFAAPATDEPRQRHQRSRYVHHRQPRFRQRLQREDHDRGRHGDAARPAGVVDATPTTTVPLSNGGWSTGISLKPDQKISTAPSAIYFVDEHGLNTLGAKLAEGRFFTADEITFKERGDNTWPPVMVVTRALANKLVPWRIGPRQAGLSRQRSRAADHHRHRRAYAGAVDRLRLEEGPDAEFYSTFVPQRIAFSNFGRYLVRT